MSTLRRLVLPLLVGIILFIGLPVIAWGLDDIQGFLANSARVGYIVITTLLQIFIVSQFPGVASTGGKGVKLVNRQRLAITMLQIISLAMVIAIPFGDRREIATFSGQVDVLRFAGLVLFVPGFLITNWAAHILGKQFSIQVTIQEDHQLITEGPYRVLRHPRYVGTILFNLGLALIFRSWLGVILCILLTGVMLWRIRDEEALLSQEFGAQWQVYAGKSWRLIPFVY